MTLDLTKPVQTRDGRKVRILCTDRNGSKHPVVGLIDTYGDRKLEMPHTWTSDGKFNSVEVDHEADLVNVPPAKKTVQVEVRLYRAQAGKLMPGSWISGGYEPVPGHIATTTVEFEIEEGAT